MTTDATALVYALEDEEVAAAAESLRPALDAYNEAVEATGSTFVEYINVGVSLTDIHYANTVSVTTDAY